MTLILYLSINLPHSEVLIKPSSFLSSLAISRPAPAPPPLPPPVTLLQLSIFETLMSQYDENNPHFWPRNQPQYPSQYDQPSDLQPRIQPRQRPGQAQPQPVLPIRYQPDPSQTPPRQPPRQTPQPQTEIGSPFNQLEPIQPTRQSPHKTPPQTAQPHRRPPQTQSENERQNLLYPSGSKTRPITWFAAVFCVILWIVIILGGLLVLIIYLVYRPRNPYFGITSATLNSAYLDMGYLLNADLTLLVNFTNPSSKVNVDFNHAILQLYFENNLIANQYIEPFSAMRAESRLASVEMVSSQVRLPVGASQQLITQMQNNAIRFEVEGLFHARSNFGSILRYSYWLYAHCSVVLTGPPSGSIVSSKCRTKR